MGKTYGTLLWLILLTVLPVFGQSDSSGNAAEFCDFALPEFSRSSGRLEYIIYGKKATNLGANITLEHPIVDIVRNDIANINEVVSLAGIKPYPLFAPQKEIANYWKTKHHSQALIFTDSAVYDKNLRIMKGDAPVYLRTPGLAMDGIGFDADQSRKFIHIRQKVRVVLYSRSTRKQNQSAVKRRNKK